MKVYLVTFCPYGTTGMQTEVFTSEQQRDAFLRKSMDAFQKRFADNGDNTSFTSRGNGVHELWLHTKKFDSFLAKWVVSEGLLHSMSEEGY